MKIQPRQIDQFVKAPDKAMRAILVYGPDTGLVRERAALLGKGVVADLNDPFNVATLTTSILDEDPARLRDEAQARSLMGGRRLIRVIDPADKIEPALKDYLKDDPNPDALIVIEAGDLKPASKLRKLAETASNMASIACYVDEARDIIPLVRDALKLEGYMIGNDALAAFAAAVKGDRQRIRMEIEKLILYMGPEKNIAHKDVVEACADAGAQGLDELISAVSAGQVAAAQSILSKLEGEGVDNTVILRSLQNHYYRLHAVRCHLDEGAGLDEAMAQLTPPVFFKQADSFRAQVMKQSAASLRRALDMLATIERRTRQTAMPAATLVAQGLLRLSRAA